MAPEILKNQKYGKEVDVWSLGVIFYILLCGYPPFHDSNQAQLFEQIKAGQYEFDPEDWASISDGAKDLITHILVVDPRKRYTTQQILAHPWVVGKVSDAPLPGTIGQLKIFNARRKLKAGMNAVRTMVRVRMMTAALVRAVAQCGFFAVCGRVAVWPCGRVCCAVLDRVVAAVWCCVLQGAAAAAASASASESKTEEAGAEGAAPPGASPAAGAGTGTSAFSTPVTNPMIPPPAAPPAQ